MSESFPTLSLTLLFFKRKELKMIKNSTKFICALVLCTIFMCTIAITACAEGSAATEGENIFSQLFEYTSCYSSEILSALAFTSSLFLAFTYKRALMPALGRSIGTISTSVAEIKDSSRETENATKSFKKELDANIEEALRLLKSLGKELNLTEEKIDKFNTGTEERNTIRLILCEQVSLLYDIFMFSSMPEYQKDAVARRIEKIRCMIPTEAVANDA